MTATTAPQGTSSAALPRVMVVDDDRDFADSLASFLMLHGCDVMTANSDTAAERVCGSFGPDVALIDLRLGRTSGLDLIAKLGDRDPNLLCVIVTAYAEIETAIQAIRRGAYDYLRKPLRNDELLVVLNRCFERQELRREHHRLETLLQASEERFRATFQHAPVGIALTDSDGKLARVNPKFSDIFGYRSDDLARMKLVDLFHPDFDGSIPHDEARPDVVEVRFQRKDGATIWGAVTVSLFPENSGVPEHNITVVEDITQRIRAEHVARQAQKMEAIGQLTGGVAHDFNNLLTVVLGNLETLDRELGGDESLHRLVHNATQGAQRGAELVQKLLAFARTQPLHPRPIDVNALVLRMVALLGRTLGEQITIATICAPDLWQVLADPIQLENGLLNLAINARDAMPAGGSLTIATSNYPLSGTAAANMDLAAGDYVRLSVADTGTGMDPDVLARACEPFFTTKDVDQGSGLGLSMIYGFAAQSGGKVEIESDLGRGTTVSLYLPRSEIEVPVEPAVSSDAIPTGDETILMVEDDEDVRSLIATFLASFGYRVIVAADGPSALRQLDRSPDIDLLVTDMIMSGGMNGRELAEEVRKRDPGTKVLFVSGYPDISAIGGSLGDDERLLPKPIRRRALARAVRRALNSDAK